MVMYLLHHCRAKKMSQICSPQGICDLNRRYRNVITVKLIFKHNIMTHGGLYHVITFDTHQIALYGKYILRNLSTKRLFYSDNLHIIIITYITTVKSFTVLE